MSNGDRQLLPVLSDASDSELAPLVEYITKAFSSGIESKARYKTHCPAHSQYADLIAHELCELVEIPSSIYFAAVALSGKPW